MESFQKRFFNKLKSFSAVQWLMAAFACFTIKLIYWSNRKEMRGADNIRALKNKPVIFVLWHGRSMMLSPIVRKLGIQGYAISSRHMDGLLMAKLQRLFGLRPIYGSTAVGAAGVLREGLRVLKSSRIYLTPDGPKGPRMRLNDGCLYFAKMSGAPIVPVCYSASKSALLKKWDKYMIAKPFGRIIYSVGEPFYFNRGNPNEMEELREKVEDFMVRQLQELDKEAGLPVIEQESLKK